MGIPVPNVDYFGEHAATFIVDGVSKHSWRDWGLVPSSRHSEPVNGVWSQAVSVPNINGQNDLVRMYTGDYVNSTSRLRKAVRNDRPLKLLTETGYKYDLLQPTSGSLSFIIGDQSVSFFAKKQEILNFLHGKRGQLILADDPQKTFNVRFSVDSFDSGETFSSVSISYSIIS